MNLTWKKLWENRFSIIKRFKYKKSKNDQSRNGFIVFHVIILALTLQEIFGKTLKPLKGSRKGEYRN